MRRPRLRPHNRKVPRSKRMAAAPLALTVPPKRAAVEFDELRKMVRRNRAGLRVGDLLMPLNLSDQTAVAAQIGKNAPGTKITLPVQRGSERIQVPITVRDQLGIALHGAALGDTTAEEALSNIYRNGMGVPKNPTEALKWLNKAAKQAYDVADFDLGWIYEHGEGVRKDDAAGAEWYRKAAEQGLPWAQYNLGAMYARGRGVAKDDKAAADWCRKAAEQAMVDAQNELGEMYARGQGVTQDYVQANEWYRKAAQQGDPAGEYNLGLSYENGRGVTKDIKAAAECYSKAAAQGVEQAKQRLAALSR